MSSSFLSPLRRPLALLGLVAVAALSACGGNASRVEPYVPTRGVVFGDENSLVSDTTANTIGGTTGNGVKYGVNYVDATSGLLQCGSYPVWSQYVLNGMGLVLAECNPSGKTPNVSMRAAYQARVAQVQAQVTAYTATTAFEPKTLVTLMAGMWDVLDQYALVENSSITLAAAQAELSLRGATLGGLVNQITQSRPNTLEAPGARVLYAEVPPLGLLPCLSSPNTAAVPTCAARANILKDLTKSFNDGLRSAVRDNAYAAALIQSAVIVGNLVDPNRNTGLVNSTSPACTSAAPNCTNSTLVSGALSGSSVLYLWADNQHLAPVAQAQIGASALDRAINNPF